MKIVQTKLHNIALNYILLLNNSLETLDENTLRIINFFIISMDSNFKYVFVNKGLEYEAKFDYIYDEVENKSKEQLLEYINQFMKINN